MTFLKDPCFLPLPLCLRRKSRSYKESHTNRTAPCSERVCWFTSSLSQVHIHHHTHCISIFQLIQKQRRTQNRTCQSMQRPVSLPRAACYISQPANEQWTVCKSQSGFWFSHLLSLFIFFFFLDKSALWQHQLWASTSIFNGGIWPRSLLVECLGLPSSLRGGWELSLPPLPTSPRPSVEWRPARWHLRKAERKRLCLSIPRPAHMSSPSCRLPPFRNSVKYSL